MQPGEIEYEFGVPIPGTIVPESEWSRTGLKHLPDSTPLDWDAILGRRALWSWTWAAATAGSHWAAPWPGRS